MPNLESPLSFPALPSSNGANNKGYLIDMDGVIYSGSQLIPGAAEFIRQLQQANIPFMFLTNNSERSPRDLVAKLEHLGLKVSWKHFYTAAHCTADFLIRQRPTSERVCHWRRRLAHRVAGSRHRF